MSHFDSLASLESGNWFLPFQGFFPLIAFWNELVWAISRHFSFSERNFSRLFDIDRLDKSNAISAAAVGGQNVVEWRRTSSAAAAAAEAVMHLSPFSLGLQSGFKGERWILIPLMLPAACCLSACRVGSALTCWRCKNLKWRANFCSLNAGSSN